MSEKDKYYMIALTMWILKNNIKDIYIYIHIHTRNRLTDTESKIVVAKEEREESRDK